MISIAPYSAPPAGSALRFAVTCFSAPEASVNEPSLTVTPGSALARFGDTLPFVACSQGRGVTVTDIGAADRLAIVMTARAPVWALETSIAAGETESPPVVCRAAAMAPPATAFCTSPATGEPGP